MRMSDAIRWNQIENAASALLDACIEEFGDPDTDAAGDEGGAMAGAEGDSGLTFKHLRDLKRALGR